MAQADRDSVTSQFNALNEKLIGTEEDLTAARTGLDVLKHTLYQSSMTLWSLFGSFVKIYFRLCPCINLQRRADLSRSSA